MSEDMSTRTRPGRVPAHVEPVSALDDVVEGRPLYEGDVTRPMVAVRFVDRVEDLETREQSRETHIAVLHSVIDQLVDQVGELRHQLGLPPWRPEYRR
jgi:hypothetical protein